MIDQLELARLESLRQECGKFGCITDKADVLWLLNRVEALIRREEGCEPKRSEFNPKWGDCQCRNLVHAEHGWCWK